MKFRILRCAESNNRYFIQKQYLGFLWLNFFGNPDFSLLSLKQCEEHLEQEIQQIKIAKQNPKAVVVKIIEVE